MALGENPSFTLLTSSDGQQSLVFFGSQIHCFNLCLYLHIAFSLSLGPNIALLIRTLVIKLGPSLIQYDLILTSLYLQRPYFQGLEVPGFRISISLSGEHNSTLNPSLLLSRPGKSSIHLQIFFERNMSIVSGTMTNKLDLVLYPKELMVWIQTIFYKYL